MGRKSHGVLELRDGVLDVETGLQASVGVGVHSH